MADQNIGRILLIVLAVIGAVALIALLAMWLMMGSMIGGDMGMMNGGMTSCCGGMMVGMYLLWGLVIVGIVAAVFLLTRRK